MRRRSENFITEGSKYAMDRAISKLPFEPVNGLICSW